MRSLYKYLRMKKRKVSVHFISNIEILGRAVRKVAECRGNICFSDQKDQGAQIFGVINVCNTF